MWIGFSDDMTSIAVPSAPSPRATSLLIGLTVLNVIGFVLYGILWVFIGGGIATTGTDRTGYMVADIIVALIGASFFAPICAWTIRPFRPTAALIVATIPALPVILILALQALPIVVLPVFILMHLPTQAGVAQRQPPAALYRPATPAPQVPDYDSLDQRRRSGLCGPIPQGLPQAVLKTEARVKAHLCGQPPGVGDDPHGFVGPVGQRP